MVGYSRYLPPTPPFSGHGKGAGQNGFNLSSRRYAPEQDHRWLTRDQYGRRADPADPANS